MNHLVVTDQAIAETLHRIRHSRRQRAQMSRLLCAIKLTDTQFAGIFATSSADVRTTQ